MSKNHPMSSCRPIKWTLDVSEVGQVTPSGHILVWAGGPIVDGPSKPPQKRADGKVDRRGAGLRKCGKCGGTGHNRRTCKG